MMNPILSYSILGHKLHSRMSGLMSSFFGYPVGILPRIKAGYPANLVPGPFVYYVCGYSGTAAGCPINFVLLHIDLSRIPRAKNYQ